VSVRDLAKCLVPSVLATSLAMAAVGALEHFLQSEQYPPLFAAVLLIGETMAFGVIFAVAMFAIVPARAATISRAVMDFTRPGQR
jgi:hypothetical protein